MQRSLYFVCFFFFLLLEIKTSLCDQNLYRLTRAVHGRTQNISLYNTDPNWYNNKPSNGTWSQGYNSGDRYAPGYVNHPYNPPRIDNRPQNTYGYNTDPNGYYPNPPPSGNTGPQWNNTGGYHNQGYNQREVGWGSQPTSGYNTEQTRYQPLYNGTNSQWQSPGSNYNQGNVNYPNRPTQTGGRPYNSWNSTGPQGNYRGNQYYAAPNNLMIHNYKRSVNNRHHNASRYHSEPNWHVNKGPRTNGTRSHYNGTGTNYYQGNWTHRVIRSLRNKWWRHQNNSSNGTSPEWRNNTQPSFNGTHWIRPGSRPIQWFSDERTRRIEAAIHYHRHYYHHENGPVPQPQYGPPPQYGPLQYGPPQYGPPQYGPRQYGPPQYGPPQYGAPPYYGPPTHHGHRRYPYYYPVYVKPTSGPGNGTAVAGSGSNESYPYVPESGAGLNGTVVNGTYHWVPENEPGSNGTYVWVPENGVGSNGTEANGSSWVPEYGGGVNGTNSNGTYPWGPEIPDLEDFDEAIGTPSPQ